MADALLIALALLPAVLWGASPVFSKRGMAAGGSALQAALVVVVVDSALYWLALLGTQGVSLFANLTLESVAVFATAGLVGTAVGRILVFAGVDRVGASINSAGVSTRPVFATLFALALLGEPVSGGTAVGILVLVAGLVVLTLSKGGDLSGWQPVHVLYPVGAALTFGLGNVLRRFGLGAYDVTVLEAVALNETAALAGLAAYALARGRTRDVASAPRDTYGYFAASGVLTAVALVSLFAALDRGPVAVVDPLAGTAPLFTTVFSYFFLRDLEAVTRGVVIGAVLVVLGAAAVTAFSTPGLSLAALVGLR